MVSPKNGRDRRAGNYFDSADADANDSASMEAVTFEQLLGEWGQGSLLHAYEGKS